MRRYHLKEAIVGDRAYLDDQDSYHARTVLRLGPGQELHVVSLDRQVYRARIEAVEPRVTLRLIERVDHDPELPVEVTIACGLSKGDKLDWIAQKGTETGMTRMIPLALKRDVTIWKGSKAQAKVDRLNRITQEAAKQSKRVVVPEVTPLMTLQDLVSHTREVGYDYLLLADEDLGHQGARGSLTQVLQETHRGDRILAVFGSEGGLDREEVAILTEAGFLTCGLGPRILRAETAPIYLLSAISYVTELMKEGE